MDNGNTSLSVPPGMKFWKGRSRVGDKKISSAENSMVQQGSESANFSEAEYMNSIKSNVRGRQDSDHGRPPGQC